MLVVLIVSVMIIPASAAEQYTVYESNGFYFFSQEPPEGVYRIEFDGYDNSAEWEYFVVDNVYWDLYEEELNAGFANFTAETRNYGTTTVTLSYWDSTIVISLDQFGVDLFPESLTFTPVAASGGSGDFLTSVGEGLNAVIAWIGTVATSLLAADGSLNGLLPLVAVGIAVTALIVAIKFLRSTTWGA